MTPTQDLRRAVDELTKPSHLRREYGQVHRGMITQIVEHLTGPSLLEELIDGITDTNNKTDRGSFGSRPPLSPDALDLWHEISATVNQWARELDIDRTKYVNDEKSGVAKLLRAISVTTAKWDDPTTCNNAGTCWTWTRRIRQMLHDQREWRGVRGATCIQCDTTWIRVARSDGRHTEHFREPAIVVIVNPVTGYIRYSRCQHCGKVTWRGQLEGAAR
jgi:hypothetical protein